MTAVALSPTTTYANLVHRLQKAGALNTPTEPLVLQVPPDCFISSDALAFLATPYRRLPARSSWPPSESLRNLRVASGRDICGVATLCIALAMPCASRLASAPCRAQRGTFGTRSQTPAARCWRTKIGARRWIGIAISVSNTVAIARTGCSGRPASEAELRETLGNAGEGGTPKIAKVSQGHAYY